MSLLVSATFLIVFIEDILSLEQSLVLSYGSFNSGHRAGSCGTFLWKLLCVQNRVKAVRHHDFASECVSRNACMATLACLEGWIAPITSQP